MKGPGTSLPRPLSCPCTSRAASEPGKVGHPRGGEELSPCGGRASEPGGLSTCVLSDRKQPNWTGRRKSARTSTFCRHSAPTRFSEVVLRTATRLRSSREKSPCCRSKSGLGTRETLNGGPQWTMKLLATHVHLGRWAM